MALYHTRPAGERALTYSDHGYDNSFIVRVGRA